LGTGEPCHNRIRWLIAVHLLLMAAPLATIDKMALYFLTGEHREYDRHGAKFERVVPNKNFDVARCRPVRGLGARYGVLDLNGGVVQGGYIQDLTLGLNWFINPNAKMQFNYVVEDVRNTNVKSAGVITAVNDDYLTGCGAWIAFDF
jgi:phosphate-selective porin